MAAGEKNMRIFSDYVCYKMKRKKINEIIRPFWYLNVRNCEILSNFMWENVRILKFCDVRIVRIWSFPNPTTVTRRMAPLEFRGVSRFFRQGGQTKNVRTLGGFGGMCPPAAGGEKFVFFHTKWCHFSTPKAWNFDRSSS